MIRYAFMTCSFHVYHMFDKMYSMDYTCLGQFIVQDLIGWPCHHLVYVFGKLQAVLDSGLEDSLERWLRYWYR